VTTWQPIDVGLPVQPVLINAPDMPPTLRDPDIYNDTRTGHSHNHPLVTPVEALTSLLEILRGRGLKGMENLGHLTLLARPIRSLHPIFHQLNLEWEWSIKMLSVRLCIRPSQQLLDNGIMHLKHVEASAQNLLLKLLRGPRSILNGISRGVMNHPPGDRSKLVLSISILGKSHQCPQLHSLMYPTNALDNYASFGNLILQESLEKRLATPDTEATVGVPIKRS
jgi:hypothetical protein